MTELLEKYLAVLKEHLPAMAAEEMRKFIEQAQKDKKELDSAVNIIAARDKTIQENLSKITELQGKVKKEETLNSWGNQLLDREEAVKEKERNLKIAELTYQLAAEQRSKTDIFTLVNTFVANPRAIEILSASKTYMNQDYWDNSGNRRVEKTGEFTTGTVEKKEIKGSTDNI